MAEDDPTDVKGLVGQHWDWRAAEFDEDSQHGIHSPAQREAWLTVLRTALAGTEGRVLDVGCGTGVISWLVAALDYSVTGVDLAPGMLRAAREKRSERSGSTRFLRGDAERLPIRTDAVGATTARHLIWTLPDPDAALHEWRRVTRPGGRVVFIEGYWDHDAPWDEYEAVHDSLPLYDGQRPATLRTRLRAAGLEPAETRSLMDATLWGREPRHEYYVQTATVPK